MRRWWICAFACAQVAALVGAAQASAMSWSAPATVGQGGLTSVSCASASLCVATSFRGLVMSTAPASGAQSWTPVTAPGQPVPCTPPPGLPPGVTFSCPPTGMPQGPLASFSPQAISCPAVTLCVAVGQDGQTRRSAVLVSTNPAGGAATWSETQFADSYGFSLVSCNTTPVCVALNFKGRVLTTNAPAGGASAWKAQDLYPYHPSGGVSCVPGMCALETYERAAGSYVLTATNPLGGVGSWTASPVSPGTNLGVLACATKHLCVAADAFGAIYASRNPASPSGRWSVDPSTYPRGNPFAHGFNAFPTSAACSPSGLCAVGEGSSVLTSTNPFGNHRWRKTKIDTVQFALSCPTSQLCVAADRTGRIVTGTG